MRQCLGGGGQNVTTFYERHLWMAPLLFVRGHAFAFEKVCVSAVYLSTRATQRSTLDSNTLERATAVPRLEVLCQNRRDRKGEEMERHVWSVPFPWTDHVGRAILNDDVYNLLSLSLPLVDQRWRSCQDYPSSIDGIRG